MESQSYILIVEARFYDDIADALFFGAKLALEKAGVRYDRVAVPGALEVPAAIAFAATSKQAPRYDGFLALGCVIRGETSHYDIVCQESARGLQDLALTKNLAIGNGILTVENEEQAWARARHEEGDKGGDAAKACLRMIELRRQWS